MKIHTCQALFLGSLILLASGAGGCGGKGGYNANDVTVTVAPAAKTLSPNGQVALLATVNNFCPECVPEIDWSVAENNSVPCLWGNPQSPPAGPCPGGTIQGQGAQGPLSPSVIYFAPSAGGTFHVIASQIVGLTSGGQTISVTGTAVITVSP
jgi:hypothetical protein